MPVTRAASSTFRCVSNAWIAASFFPGLNLAPWPVICELRAHPRAAHHRPSCAAPHCPQNALVPATGDGMRRPVYDRSLVGASTNSKRTRSAKRRPALKKNSTSNAAQPTKQGPARSRKTNSKTTTKLTVGIDLGDKQSAYCILDAEGDVLSEGTIRTTEGGFEQQFQSMKACRIALET